MFVSPLRQEDPRVAQDDPRSHWDGSATEAGSKLEEVGEGRRERRVGYQSSPVVVSGNAMPNRLRSPTSPGAIERNNVRKTTTSSFSISKDGRLATRRPILGISSRIGMLGLQPSSLGQGSLYEIKRRGRGTSQAIFPFSHILWHPNKLPLFPSLKTTSRPVAPSTNSNGPARFRRLHPPFLPPRNHLLLLRLRRSPRRDPPHPSRRLPSKPWSTCSSRASLPSTTSSRTSTRVRRWLARPSKTLGRSCGGTPRFGN